MKIVIDNSGLCETLGIPFRGIETIEIEHEPITTKWTGQKHTDETKEVLREKRLGKKSPEHGKFMKEFMKGNKHLEGHTPWNVGKPWSDEVKQKLRGKRDCISGENNPSKRDDVREKIRQSKLGKKRPGLSAMMTGKKRGPYKKRAAI